MKNKRIKKLVYGATIAALYVVLTYFSSLLGLSSGAIQFRISEALTILPIFMPCAVPGLFAGCIIANLLSGCVIWDVILGSFATLLGAIFTRLFRKKTILAFMPPIFFNTLIVPPVIYYIYETEQTLILTYITVFIGEALSCGLFGTMLYRSLKYKTKFIGEFNEQ